MNKKQLAYVFGLVLLVTSLAIGGFVGGIFLVLTMLVEIFVGLFSMFIIIGLGYGLYEIYKALGDKS